MAKLPLPIYSKTARTGDRGIRISESIVCDQLGWIFKEQEAQKDFGVDAHIELLDDDGRALGRLIAAQIKCGKSFFRNKTKDGFVFYGQNSHLNYYLNYSLPVIVVLCDPETGECWWCEINPSESEQTKQGWRITVPYAQPFDQRAKARLLKLAGLTQDYIPALEHYWSGNKLLLQPFGLFHIIIAREDVESGDPSRVLEILERFLPKKIATKNRELLDFSVDGYDEDKRELYEIPEVREWFAELNTQFGYWFYFLSKKTKSLRLLSACLCNYQKTNGGVVVNGVDLSKFIETAFISMNTICEKVGMSEVEIKQLSESAMKYFYPEFSFKKAKGANDSNRKTREL